MKRNIIHLCLSFLFILVALTGNSRQGTAQAGDAYSLIDAVNNLRAANGLPPYQVNSILMTVAQGHSDYQAAIGQVTHTGAGGTRPRDRAAAAGYGGGANFFMSENIAGGNDLSVDKVISWWLGDAPHTNTMLGANYQNVGAGVAVSGDFVYYTLDVASGVGGDNSSPAVTITPGGPTPIPIYLVLTGTAKPDGSVIHVVLSGQTLIGIAIAYGMTVAEIKALNNLTSDAIYVGDKLVIHPAAPASPTATSAPITPTRAATSTRHPTRTPTPSSTPIASSVPSQADPAQEQTTPSGSDPVGNILVIAVVSLAAGGLLLMVVGSVMKRSKRG